MVGIMHISMYVYMHACMYIPQCFYTRSVEAHWGRLREEEDEQCLSE